MEQTNPIDREPIVGVIPARFESTRFPGKLLQMLGDRTVLHHVHENARRSRVLDAIVVATDDERILREVLAFEGTAVMTSPTHRSGTERVAEAVRDLPRVPARVVNIQGDEPFLGPEEIDAVARAVRDDPTAVWTAVCPFSDPEAVGREDAVKAVLAADGRVLYFSRAPVPHRRTGGGWTPAHRHHVGIYGFATAMLARFIALPCSPLEELEGLEQLRLLEAGIPMRAVEIPAGFGGIDTREDLQRAREHLAAGLEGGTQ
ncbi:MAG: 3-deoxy-manno-octulosonate cytidylyltransferase [Candidatus Eisenbacteria bacterium]|nr:3-deoxy-manno-octulosonate cytidylyltransferase [Candidatus Latescibacterota bacterium]MBD3303366.1 3-deoxy-manno-octulosonate cytidylyltransferase [Candidatus Eisenbacteria bacterium]